MSAINACDNFALSGCLVDADLLIIGRQMGRSDDAAANSATTDAIAVADAVEAFARRDKPVMYVHYSRDATELTKALFTRVLGINPEVTTNFWLNSGLLDLNRTSAPSSASSTIVALQRAINSVFDGAGNASGVALTADEYLPCFVEDANTWQRATCTAGFDHKVRKALLSLRSYVMGLDRNSVDLFPIDDPKGLYTPREMRIAVLLGDKARERIVYPFNRSDMFDFVNAMYGDASVLYRRSQGPVQNDLGSLTCPEVYLMDPTKPRPVTCIGLGFDYRNYSSTVQRFDNVTVNQSTLMQNTWTTTGLYAVPGHPIRVRRIDANGAAVATYVTFWFQREATTKAFEPRGDLLCGYNRPQFARSHDVQIPADGREVTISPPFGGPIYLQLNGLLPEGGALEGAYTTTLVFENVARHPTILDMASDASGALFVRACVTFQLIVSHDACSLALVRLLLSPHTVEAFFSLLQISPLPVVDIRGEGVEVHARKDKFTDSLTVSGYGNLMNYTGSDGVRRLVDDYRFRFVEYQYTLAGFKAPGTWLVLALQRILFCAVFISFL